MLGLLGRLCYVGFRGVRGLFHGHAAIGRTARVHCARAALILGFADDLDVYHCSISFKSISAEPSLMLRLMPCTKNVLPIAGWR